MADFADITSTSNYNTPKALYIGVDGVARKVKKAYIGVDNVARKVKKMYLGVDGVARCIFSGGGELNYYGTATSLSQARNGLASTTVGDYALFGGGNYNRNSVKTVDAYNTSLTRSTPTSLNFKRFNLASTTVGNYALFGGGIQSSQISTVDVYQVS